MKNQVLFSSKDKSKKKKKKIITVKVENNYVKVSSAATLLGSLRNLFRVTFSHKIRMICQH